MLWKFVTGVAQLLERFRSCPREAILRALIVSTTQIGRKEMSLLVLGSYLTSGGLLDLDRRCIRNGTRQIQGRGISAPFHHPQ